MNKKPMPEDHELEEIKRRMLERLMIREAKPSLLQAGTVNLLTDANFDQAISSTLRPILVDFWADWCIPCKMMAPVVESLARDYLGRADFAKLNTDQNPLTSSRYRIMSIPNFIIFKGGRPVDQVIGALGKQELELTLKKHLS